MLVQGVAFTELHPNTQAKLSKHGTGGQMKLEIIFPLLMVVGAAGSLVTNIINKGEWATSLQWVGAALLYTALTFRNMG